jgi:hypothetical protein
MHICYVSYNSSEDIGYVGYEPGNGNSQYYGSSDHPAFLYAKRNGKLTKYVVGTFETELEARTAENFAIKKLREGGMNLYNRNVGGGGKDGNVNDYRVLRNDFRNVIDLIMESRNFPELNNEPDARKIADRILSNIKNGNYEIFDESLKTLSKYKYIQVRIMRHLKAHIRDLTDRMVENPELFRKNTDPVIVVVDDRNPNKVKYVVIGGNHRIVAAINANWDTFPAVYINFSELNYNDFNLKYLGQRDNSKNAIVEKQMDENDVKIMLQEYHELHPEMNPNSQEFKDSFVNLYKGGSFSETRLKQNVTNFAKNYNESVLASKYNFHQYDDKELKAIKNYISLLPEFADSVYVSDTVSTLMNNGIGGVLNLFGASIYHTSIFGREPKKSGVIIGRFVKPSELETQENCIDQFDWAMQIAGFKTKDRVTWKNDNGYSVRIIILPHVHESDDTPIAWSSFEKAVKGKKIIKLNDSKSKAA